MQLLLPGSPLDRLTSGLGYRTIATKKLQIGAYNCSVAHNMHGHRLASDIKLGFKREEVLVKLRENLERHKTILAEADKGYIAKAHGALRAKLAELAEGNPVKLRFELAPPTSHVQAYESVISMLEAATDDVITLSMEQQQAFMCDRWEWRQEFLESNSGFVPRIEHMYNDWKA